MSPKAKEIVLFVSLWLLSVAILSWVLIEVQGAEKVFNCLVILAFFSGGIFLFWRGTKGKEGLEGTAYAIWPMSAQGIFGGAWLTFNILAKSSHPQTIWDEVLVKSSYTLHLETTAMVFQILFFLATLTTFIAFKIDPANKKSTAPASDSE